MKSLPTAKFPVLNYAPELPITEKRALLVDAIKDHQVLVITGETGSGKTTQIPKLCLEAGRGVRALIGCTQPRRIAAITVAQRVAEELGPSAASLVGYKIRFQDRTARSTRIKFMTDGILLAEAQTDRLLRAYDTLIIDEAHERNLNIDFLLGLIKQILPQRADLKIIITSATIDPEKFSRAFQNAPILEVSGRVYPVAVQYRPLTTAEDAEDDVTYVDQAVSAVESLKGAGRRGDILIFMPTASDIRETAQRLEERKFLHTLVLPLFGRMAAVDQHRVFHPTAEAKIIVATNVAETSLTIPGIKYVIDTGLARIAQYNPRSRTQTLPVAPISQASAEQRKGRCGRVEAGICLRLYSEEDYLARPHFTPPEIQRSNLAEVILRMLYLRLGDIEAFPFLDPPAAAAIKDGFAVLQELGAVDAHRELTPIGKTMARLPLDPRLARILIEGQREGALREALIVVAALSIQDPRERPLEQESQADRKHARFRNPRSDFATLLKIREEYQRHQETAKSQNQMRKFCKENFLSYRRMREWLDVAEQIEDILEELGSFSINSTPASYEALHRAIVSGYLSNIALRKEKNLYQATKGRQVMLYPGSGLFNKGGSWIVAAELVHTTRLFARTVANVEPDWLEALGKHLCRYHYFEPHWEKRRGQVVAYERVTLYGLTIVERRKVHYGRINLAEAREIFIRSALLAGELPGKYAFLEHNRELLQRIEEMESKTRRRDLLVEEAMLYHFYDQRLPAFADLRSFNKFLKEHNGDGLLRMTEADLLRTAPNFEALERFPDFFPWDDAALPLHYVFDPGQADDGVSVQVPLHLLPRLDAEPFEWLVPGLLLEKLLVLLKALPKGLRRHLSPIAAFAEQVWGALRFYEGNFYLQLSRTVAELGGVQVTPAQWDRGILPDHLRMRFVIVDPDAQVLSASRDWARLPEVAVERREDQIWEQARKRWEKAGLTRWDLGDLPARIDLGSDAFGVNRHAYPALIAAGSTVAIRLLADPQEALQVSRDGLLVLYQQALAAELKPLLRAWRFPPEMDCMLWFLGQRRSADLKLQVYLLRELFGTQQASPPLAEHFQRMVNQLQGRLAGLGQQLLAEVLEMVRARHATSTALLRYTQMSAANAAARNRLELLQKELDELAPDDILATYPRLRIVPLPRYLKALQRRAERAYAAPEKDLAKAEHLVAHEQRYQAMKASLKAHPHPAALLFLDDFRWLIEEYKVSLFAPEIKTAVRISSKVLEAKWQEGMAWR